MAGYFRESKGTFKMTEGTPQTFKITKRYGRTVTVNFQAFNFNTELTTEVTVASGQELADAANRLFAQAQILTENDIAQTFPQEMNGEQQ